MSTWYARRTPFTQDQRLTHKPFDLANVETHPHDDRPKHRKWHTRAQHDRIDDTSIAILHQLAQHHGETQLTSSRQPIDAIASDEHIEGLCGRSNNIAQHGEQGGRDEEVAAAKDVAELDDMLVSMLVQDRGEGNLLVRPRGSLLRSPYFTNISTRLSLHSFSLSFSSRRQETGKTYACQLTANHTLTPEFPSPSSFTIRLIVFAGNTQPRYPDICARQVATSVPMNWGEV